MRNALGLGNDYTKGPPIIPPTYIKGNVLRGRKENNHKLVIWGRVQARFDKEGPWYEEGDLLLMSKIGYKNEEPKWFIDITLTDFLDMTDYLKYFDLEGEQGLISGGGCLTTIGKDLYDDIGGKVKAVKVACLGDQKKGEKEVQVVKIPKLHPAFETKGSHEHSPSIAFVVDMSFFVWKARDAGFMPGLVVGDELKNPMMAEVFRELEHPTAFGRLLEKWNHERMGSVYILQPYRKDIDVKAIEGILRFCQKDLMPLVESCKLHGDKRLLRDQIWVALEPVLGLRKEDSDAGEERQEKLVVDEDGLVDRDGTSEGREEMFRLLRDLHKNASREHSPQILTLSEYRVLL